MRLRSQQRKQDQPQKEANNPVEEAELSGRLVAPLSLGRGLVGLLTPPPYMIPPHLITVTSAGALRLTRDQQREVRVYELREYTRASQTRPDSHCPKGLSLTVTQLMPSHLMNNLSTEFWARSQKAFSVLSQIEPLKRPVLSLVSCVAQDR